MSKLNILWTTAELPTIENMLCMYTINSIKNKWWDEINIIIWGASSKAVGEEPKIRELIKKMLDSGITIEACKACADKYKTSSLLKELGVTVKYMHKITEYIKGEDHFITI